MVIDFSKSAYEEAIKNNKVIVLYFHAVWCGPCVSFKNVYENISNSMPDIIFGKINVDDLRDIAIKYAISSIPSIVLIKNQKPIWHCTGTVEESYLKKNIETEIAK